MTSTPDNQLTDINPDRGQRRQVEGLESVKVFGRDLDRAIAAEARVVEEEQHFRDDVVPGDDERAAVFGRVCSQ